ncbi:hypothetical protein JCM11251_006589 [Rhodosporidiobolus azoricus]
MGVTVHPYKTGNYLPVREERALERCEWEGELPVELAGGMYVRNGGAPALEEEEGEEGGKYHWFDGDGMLTGVFFDIVSPPSPDSPPRVAPTFVNRYVLTDVFLASKTLGIRAPILPSISTLLGSFRTLHLILFSIFRAVFLAFLSFFTSSPLRRLSVANTSILWHDGRALASCESGPLAQVVLPSLETAEWWSLEGDNGEKGLREKGGLLGWMKEWTTAHPKHDPLTGELLLYHMTFFPPYLHYSVIPSTATRPQSEKAIRTPRILAAPVPIDAPKMMHDMAASRTHTILLDLPLTLDPRNLICGKPVITYDPSSPSRFGVFPRHSPDQVKWYEAPPCIIFHTAFGYDEIAPSAASAPHSAPGDLNAVNLVCCRLNSPRLIYSAGNLPLPLDQVLPEVSRCELYYYRFPSTPIPSFDPQRPSHAFPLSAISFEFPTVPQDRAVGPSKFVYGCSVKHGSFDAALGAAAKIDCLVKVDVETLVARGRKRQEAGEGGEEVPVDGRTVAEVLAQQTPRRAEDSEVAPIRIFELPPQLYAQEASFVPRRNPRSEDDGFLVTYVFDERQLDSVTGRPRADARSELWIVDAWNMRDVVAKIKLPQRVPYGLHGHWFPPHEIQQQRAPTSLRRRPESPK